MVGHQGIAPDLLFRLLGYGGLGLIGAVSLAADSSFRVWLLLAVACCWPGIWCLGVHHLPRLRSPRTPAGLLAHAGESLLVLMLVVNAGLGPWLVLAVGLSILTGVTALGGLRLLAPCALVVIALLCRVPEVTRLLDKPATLASALLVTGLLLAVGIVSHARVRRLDRHRRRITSESQTLRHRNARLSRYLPEGLAQLVGESAASVQRPTNQFVSVAFIDVVGFATLVASRPLPELIDVVNDFMAAVTRLTEGHGGIVGKFLGDGVLVYFPTPDDDDGRGRSCAALGCASLCLALEPTLADLAAAWRRRGLGQGLSCRAGIASGYCAIGDWGGEQRLDYTLIGTPVNLASRLQAQAARGRILVCPATAALLEADPVLARCLRVGVELPLKGLGVRKVHELAASAKVRANRSPLPNPSNGKGISPGLPC